MQLVIDAFRPSKGQDGLFRCLLSSALHLNPLKKLLETGHGATLVVRLSESFTIFRRLYPARIGARWVKSGETPLLVVPAAVIYQERNYLINPAHPEMARVQMSDIEDYTVDQRFLS